MIDQFYYKKRVLITGGSGFIGKHLQKKLFNYDASITIIDKNPNLLDKRDFFRDRSERL